MGFLKSLFGRGSASRDAISKVDVGKYLYLLNYEDRYADVLALAPDRKVAICELYIFRGWTTQWALRLWSSDPDGKTGNKIIYEVWNTSGTLGRVVMEAKYKIAIPDSSTVGSRWKEYDQVFLRHGTKQEPIPALPLASKAARFCGIHDPTGISLLAVELLAHFKDLSEEISSLRFKSIVTPRG
jgi:hypothetical protein